MSSVDDGAMSGGAAAAEPSRRVAWRRLWIKVHLYLGLVVGPALAVIGLTGTLMVFNTAMMKAEYEYFGRASAGAHVPMEAWFAGAQARYPDLVGHEPLVVLPGARHRWFGSSTALLIYEALDVGAATEDSHLFVVVDPATGEALGRFVYEQGWSGLPYLLHSTLLLPFGDWFVTLAGAVFLVSLATGAWLWWPSGGRVLRALTIRRNRGRRVFLRDLHTTTAIVVLVPLVSIAISGFYLIRSEWFEPLVSDGPTRSAASLPPECSDGLLTLDEAAAVVARERPGHQLLTVAADTNPRGFVYFASASRGGLLRPPPVETAIDRSCTTPVKTDRDAHVGDWMIVFHSGEILGWLGFALAMAAGIVLCASFVTGLLMWRRRPAGRSP